MESCNCVGNLIITCCNVKIVINRFTGLPCLISKDGVNILADADILDTAYSPCRVHLHRAPIDNDRIGYSSSWEALGLDQQLMYVPNGDRIDDDVSKYYEEFNGVINTEYCTYHRLPRLNDGSEGFEVKWRMKPSHINIWKIEYIKSITSFYDSDEYTHIDVSVNSYEEEVYVYHLCSIHQLVWETTPVDLSLQKASIKVRKLNLNMCTTIKKASRTSPILSQHHKNESASAENSECMYPISWCVTYYMSITGKLSMKVACDLNELSFIPIPRVGIQLQLHPRMKDVIWSGCGPHECYSDRKYSTVNAIHQASIDSLHVPYIRPSENGNRCDIDWLQISSDVYYTENSRNKSGDDSLTNSRTSDQLSASTSASSVTPDIANQGDNTNGEISQIDFNSDNDSADASIIDDKISCRIHSSKLFNFSAQYHTTEDLMQIPNSKDLEALKRKFISLNIDGHLMGIGGDDSWTASVHEEYLLKHKQGYHFDLIVDFI